MSRDIISNSANKNKYKLIVSESIVTLNLNDGISIPIVTDNINWTFNLVFIDDITKSNFAADINFVGNEIIYKMYNWYSDSFVENISPIKFSSKGTNPKHFQCRLRVTGTKKSSSRLVNISIWQEIEEIKMKMPSLNRP